MAVSKVSYDNSITVPAGGATAANQTAVQAVAGSDASKANAVQGITGGKPVTVKIDQTTPGTTNLVAAGQSGVWTVQPGNTANTTAWKVDGSAVTQPVSGTVTANAGSGTFTTKELRCTTGTITSVASNAGSVAILASNANRLGGSVFNESTQILYLSWSATAASITVYSAQVLPGGYTEIPFGYTGQLTGIWASANGSARVTEMT